LTGIIPTKADNPHVPITPEEIVEDAIRCHEAGASIIHVHARDDEGRPTYRSVVYKEIIDGIRSNIDVIICVSTSGRRVQEFERRSEVLALRPEMATLTMGSVNSRTDTLLNPPDIIMRLATKMWELGVKPELEIFEPGMLNYAKYLIKKGALTSKPPCFNLFFGLLGGIPAELKDMGYLISSLPEGAVWGCAGIGRYQLRVNVASIVFGGNVRVGLEDNLYFDEECTELATNTLLVKRLVEIAAEVGRPVASVSKAREILNIV
jgi:uncharacterized protein (DUF849 family)